MAYRSHRDSSGIIKPLLLTLAGLGIAGCIVYIMLMPAPRIMAEQEIPHAPATTASAK
ncbi:MAG: hypothetical protein AB7G80_06050 [Dongiaceae bacterium]